MKFAIQRSSDSCRGRFLVGVSILLLLAGLWPAKSESAVTPPVIPASPVADEDAGPSRAKSLSCLPKDVRADEAVSYGTKGKSILTVEKKLAEMKARCQRGKLLDAKGREIRFFRVSCWGNPPDDYQEIQKRENEELGKLKKRYTVIVFGCNPMIQ
ncbi:MAG: hypothetical protein DMF70_00130 [Acidobacteria bacterium]|nr:MAG: hypothetical protein DMF70_00130 [Acidobacteriota bacterium]